MLAERVTINAASTRTRLFDALAPILRGVERLDIADPGDLRIHVRPHALPGERPGARVFVMAGDREVSHGLADHMPTGPALSAAAEDALALALSGLDDDSFDDAERLALAHPGSLMVIADPAAGSVKVAIVAGGRAVVLGALVDGPARAH